MKKSSSSGSSITPTQIENFTPSDFIYAIIHELKNPLNAILGFAEILKMEIKDPAHAEDCLDWIKEINLAAVELSELIHDLLDVGAATSGNFAVDLSNEINVADAIKRSVKLNKDYAIRRRISLKVEIAEDVLLIKLDEKRVKQILSNLISNAVKYSAEKTTVSITAKNFTEKNNQKYLEITISDQGFGMTPAQVETAFMKYKTIENPNSGKVDSFGLGLPIVKQLVELQKGEIGVTSEVGKGTSFVIKFPYSS